MEGVSHRGLKSSLKVSNRLSHDQHVCHIIVRQIVN